MPAECLDSEVRREEGLMSSCLVAESLVAEHLVAEPLVRKAAGRLDLGLKRHLHSDLGL